MYEELTKYIELLDGDDYGRVVKQESPKDKIIIEPIVEYSETVQEFFKDIYKFMDDHEEFQSIDYLKLTKKKRDKNGQPQYDKLNAQETYAFMLYPLRAARFGSVTAPLGYLEKGIYQKLLEHLKELDTNSLKD